MTEKIPDNIWDEASAIQKAALNLRKRRGVEGLPDGADYQEANIAYHSDMRSSEYLKNWDEVYATLKPEEIAWNLPMAEEIKEKILELNLKKGDSALDAGCGLGGNSAKLEEMGFSVTGIDISGMAIEKNKKEYEGKSIDFQICNALDIPSLGKKFMLVLDISLFHHISPDERKNYAKAIALATDPGAIIVLCCFSDQEPYFEGKKEVMMSTNGTLAHIPSEDDIRDTFGDYFIINELKQVKFGKSTKLEKIDSKKRHMVVMTRNEKKVEEKS